MPDINFRAGTEYSFAQGLDVTASNFPSSELLRRVGSPVVIASFMRSGTHLAIDTLRANFDCFTTWKYPLEKNSCLYADLDVYMRPVKLWQRPGLRKRLIRPSRPMFKSHWALSHWSTVKHLHPQLTDWIEDQGRIILVVRDPRKILLSNIAWDCSLASGSAQLDLPALATSLLAKLRRRWMEIITCDIAPLYILDASVLLTCPSMVLAELSKFLHADLSYDPPVLPAPLSSQLRSRLQRLYAVRPPSTAILTHCNPSDYSWLLDTEVVRNALTDLFDDDKLHPLLSRYN